MCQGEAWRSDCIVDVRRYCSVIGMPEDGHLSHNYIASRISKMVLFTVNSGPFFMARPN